MILIKKIYKSFDDYAVLKDVSFEIEKGVTQVILGKSGTGKSVLLKIIVGLMEQDSGEVSIFNEVVDDSNIKKLNKIRKKIGFLFQNSALYDSLSVGENLEFALVRRKKNLSKKEIIERIEKYLNAVGLLDAVDKMPSELSGGMRKRIGLARSLVIEPEIMLYDEPTTGLDPITTREISLLIKEVQEKFNLTSIVVTHDLECAKIVSNRIALLNNGSIEYFGTYEDFMISNLPFIRQFIGKV